MAVYKEEKTNTWRAVYRYTDWNGERKQTQKRGFKTKREAQAWEREQLNKASADLDMTFKSFVDLYTADMKTRLKENTWATKEHIICTKLRWKENRRGWRSCKQKNRRFRRRSASFGQIRPKPRRRPKKRRRNSAY
ncbi:Arm DNA-binding domain-containing protein [Flavonifractor sp. An112]|uniref:Arm DNA-binding domain-containing protein n=1 Tax=Flavonifractor sp. An112 TaxID=1965544 RepID=UPI0026AC7DEF